MTGTVLTVSIGGDSNNLASDLSTWQLYRPCYLATALNGDVDVTETISLGGGGLVVNGASFTDSTTYLNAGTAITTGQLVELDVSGIGAHPFHMHVNHFQLQSDLGTDGYFAQGDWHDTLLQNSGSTNVRFYSDTFTGKAVVHCHILEHEDQGMMGIIYIGGTEGAVYSKATDLDSTCYREATGKGYVQTSSPDTDDDDDGDEDAVDSETLTILIGSISGVVALVCIIGICYATRSPKHEGRMDDGVEGRRRHEPDNSRAHSAAPRAPLAEQVMVAQVVEEDTRQGQEQLKMATAPPTARPVRGRHEIEMTPGVGIQL